jgi:hypothetical protein
MQSPFPQQFRFCTTFSSIKGGVGGALLIGGWLIWAKFTGRIHDPDAIYWGGWGLGFLVISILLWRGHRASVQHAHALGQIHLDAVGVRWLRGDRTVFVEFPWHRVVEAFVERRTSTVAVVVRAEDLTLTPNAYLLGDRSGYVRFENFDAFLQTFGRYCELKDSIALAANQSRSLTRKSFVAAAMFGALSATLLWINGKLEAGYSLRHAFPLAPTCLGFLALVYVFAGFAFMRGRAPMVSPLYIPSFWTRRMPLTGALMVAINFLLVWLLGT